MRAMFSFHGGHHLYDNRGLPDDVDVLAHAVLFRISTELLFHSTCHHIGVCLYFRVCRGINKCVKLSKDSVSPETFFYKIT